MIKSTTDEEVCEFNEVPAPYYHVTSRKAVREILANGLRAGSDNHIYLLSSCDLRLIISVARGQCGLSEAVVIEVCATGVISKAKRDNVAEAFAPQQWRVRQKLIPADCLTEVCRIVPSRWYSSNATFMGTSNAQLRPMVTYMKRAGR